MAVMKSSNHWIITGWKLWRVQLKLENSFPPSIMFVAANVQVFYSRAIPSSCPTNTSFRDWAKSTLYFPLTRLEDFLDWLISCRSSRSAFSAELPDTSFGSMSMSPLLSSRAAAGPLWAMAMVFRHHRPCFG